MGSTILPENFSGKEILTAVGSPGLLVSFSKIVPLISLL